MEEDKLIPSPFMPNAVPPTGFAEETLIKQIVKETGSDAGFLFLMTRKKMKCDNHECDGTHALAINYKLRREDAIKIIMTLMKTHEITEDDI